MNASILEAMCSELLIPNRPVELEAPTNHQCCISLSHTAVWTLKTSTPKLYLGRNYYAVLDLKYVVSEALTWKNFRTNVTEGTKEEKYVKLNNLFTSTEKDTEFGRKNSGTGIRHLLWETG